MNFLQRFFGKASVPAPAALPERGIEPITQPMGRPSWQLTELGFVNPFATIPQHQRLDLYEQLVELVPIINAALARIVQLVGCPKPVSETNPTAAEELLEWWEGVKVNRIQTGGGNWFAGWCFDHLMYGRAHAEIILTGRKTDIYALQELHTRTIDLRPRATGYGVDIVQSGRVTGIPQLLNPQLILTAVHDVRQDSPQGNSL
ncbi:MAG TPA: hypothetical protein VIM84_02600, partial [Gemmatimonadales bacterium]